MPPPELPIQTFDRNDDYSIVERSSLPHWVQAGTLAFITWRTWDSLPKQVLSRWLAARATWLRNKGIDPLSKNWREQVHRLPPSGQAEFQRFISARWESHLDECHGACPLRRPDCARIACESLFHSDGDKYWLTDFVIMPNHVHLLAAFRTEEGMLKQCKAWKRFTAVELNRLLGRSGRFWEEDQFDHLVRSDEEFVRIRMYIAENPATAQINSDEFVHYSRALASAAGHA